MPQGVPLLANILNWISHSGAIGTLVLFIAASAWIGYLAERAVRNSEFMRGFFQGNRGLGAWTLALTATVQSGGTFIGFPSYVYSHGWTVALWICGYMVVPITGFGILGKRLAQLCRKTGAITVPDLFRARFDSPELGLASSLLIIFYMTFMMTAQFKAGAVIMKNAFPGVKARSLAEEFDPFLISDGSLAAAVAAGVPPEVADQARALVGQGFRTEKELKQRLRELLDRSVPSAQIDLIASQAALVDWAYFVGLGIFAATVLGYTLLGGFLAAVWTDLFQSVMMLVGVVILLAACLSATGGIEPATIAAVKNTSLDFAYPPGHPADKAFLPFTLAISFFAVWVFSGLGSPAGMVRIMASKNTEVIRKSIYLLSIYNFFIYLPLVVICICGRAMIPNLAVSDEIIPRLAMHVTEGWFGGSWVSGLILAAPFGAVMATVSSYLVVIASGLVRDVYQRLLNPQATEYELRRVSTYVMLAIGAIAVAANIRPIAYLQVIVVFSGTGAAATFCIPALMLAFWRRATVPGVLCAMLGGALTMVVLYGVGAAQAPTFTNLRPYYLLGFDPLLWGLLVSALLGFSVSRFTPPLPRALVSKFFDAQPIENRS